MRFSITAAFLFLMLIGPAVADEPSNPGAPESAEALEPGDKSRGEKPQI